jgi:hydrogenase-4 component E
MDSLLDRLMLLLILSDVAFLAASRLRSAIGLLAGQGILVGVLAIVALPGPLTSRAVLLAAAGLSVRGLLFPWLLRRVQRHAVIREELDPIIGQGASVLLGIVMLGGAMTLGARLHLHSAVPSDMVVPAALFTIFTGVFLVITRRKALTQCLGYIVIENGIYTFGVAAVGEVPALVELGALLDLFVAVLVMGVAIYRLNEAFDHIDTDQLTALRG